MDGNLTAADLAKVTQLGLAERRIKDLTRLGDLPNLRGLWLYRNQIQDLPPDQAEEAGSFVPERQQPREYWAAVTMPQPARVAFGIQPHQRPHLWAS